MGALGLPEILILSTLVGVAALFGRRGVGGPTLALRKFDVDPTGPVTVLIEGRPSGLIGWLLTTIGLDTLTTLKVTTDQVLFRSASLSGETHHLVPTTAISSTHSGYSQPIWLLVVAGVIVLFSLIAAAGDGSGGAFVGGLIIAAIVCLVYVFQRKIVISLETTGGLLMGLSFKPSVIENVSIDLARALAAVDRINGIVVARSHRPPL